MSEKNIFKIKKPIRLIELFAGIGAQAKALENLKVNFEHYKICEWEVDAFKSYNAIHMNDNTNYSIGKNKEELVNLLFEMGISSDGKSVMKYETIKRKGENWLKDTYNAIRQTHNLVDISQIKGKDLEIVDTDIYDYLLTYSFPCTNLSLAGKQEGMAEGSGTASSLIWEVKRLLKECKENGQLPQILLMENVPQVHSAKNIENFNAWLDFLKNLGYSNSWQDLNAKQYGIPQNRNRCYMISILKTDKNYEFAGFPKEIPLTKRLIDVLENEVDKKYYLKEETVNKFIANNKEQLIKKGIFDNINIKQKYIFDDYNSNLPKNQDIVGTITTNFGSTSIRNAYKVLIIDAIFNCRPSRFYDVYSPTIRAKRTGLQVMRFKEPIIGASRGRYDDNGATTQNLEVKNDSCSNTIATVAKDNLVIDVVGNYMPSGHEAERIFNPVGIAPTVKENHGLSMSVVLNEPIGHNIQIRRLTPKECWRLMGFSDEDIEKCRNISISESRLYKQAGNSICVPVLEAIFKQLF